MTLAPAAVADRSAPLRGSELGGVRWRRWAVLLAAPALLIGILGYPDIHARTMPLAVAVLLLAAAGAGLVLSGRPHLVILLPLISAFLPSPQAGFAAYLIALALVIVVYGPRRMIRQPDAVDWLLLAVVGWAGMSWLVNLGIETDPWSLPLFALTFLAPWLIIFVARAAPWSRIDREGLFGCWLALAVAQLAVVYVKPLVLGLYGAYGVPLALVQFGNANLLRDLAFGSAVDVTFGTMQSAHHLGIALLLLLASYVALRLASGRRMLTLLSVTIGFAFLMTDSKHVILAAIPGALVYVARVVWPHLSRSARRALVAGAVAFALLLGWRAGVVVGRVIVRNLWEPYVTLATFNPKVQLIVRTAERLGRNDLNTWIGLGPGAFASRAATIRATDVLYKETAQLPAFIPAHTGDSYRAAAYDLYTSEVAATATFRSGALTNPFSSLVGILA